MRRVPADRPTAGPDDPMATRPVRGRPLKTGNPWRYQAQDDTPRVSRPAPARASSADRTESAMESFRELMRRFARDPDHTLELTTDVGDGSDCMDVVRIADAFDQKNPHVGLCWEASKNWKKVKFWIDRDTDDAAVPTISRTNLNQSQRVVPRMPQTLSQRAIPTRQQATVMQNYVNPLTCPHPQWSYDAGNNVYQCRKCSHVVPAQNMRIVQG